MWDRGKWWLIENPATVLASVFGVLYTVIQTVYLVTVGWASQPDSIEISLGKDLTVLWLAAIGAGSACALSSLPGRRLRLRVGGAASFIGGFGLYGFINMFAFGNPMTGSLALALAAAAAVEAYTMTTQIRVDQIRRGGGSD